MVRIVWVIERRPHAKARRGPCHWGESSGGSATGSREERNRTGITGDEGACVKEVAAQGWHAPQRPPSFRGGSKSRSRNDGGVQPYPLADLLRRTKQAPPARRMRLQRSSASGRVSAPMRTW